MSDPYSSDKLNIQPMVRRVGSLQSSAEDDAAVC